MKTSNNKLNLYNKYRPKKISELVGQQSIINLILQSFKKDKLIQSFIFYGPNGIGKTSLARIVAKAWNCEKFKETGDVCNECNFCVAVDQGNTADIYEIDAASHSGVENMRWLTNSTKYMALDLKKKIYIVDEAHSLSAAAWNALLKPIEEPNSENIFFIFITTNIYKVPKTILSRCSRYNFSAISEPDLCEIIDRVVAGEGREITEEAKNSLASLANGSARECVSLLEQVLLDTVGLVQFSDLERVFAIANKQEALDFMSALIDKDLVSSTKMLIRFSELNKNLRNLFMDLVSFFVDLYLFEKTSNISLLEKLTDVEAEQFMNKGFNFLACLEVLESAVNRFSDKQTPLNWAQITLFNLFELINELQPKESSETFVSIEEKSNLKLEPEITPEGHQLNPFREEVQASEKLEDKKEFKQVEPVKKFSKPGKTKQALEAEFESILESDEPEKSKSQSRIQKVIDVEIKEEKIPEEIVDSNIEVEKPIKKVDDSPIETKNKSEEEVVFVEEEIKNNDGGEYQFSLNEQDKIVYGLNETNLDMNLSVENCGRYRRLFKDSKTNAYPELKPVFEKASFFKDKETGKKQLFTTDHTVVVVFKDTSFAAKFNHLVKDSAIKQTLHKIFMAEYEWFGITLEQCGKYRKLAESGKPISKSIFSNSRKIDRFEQAWEFLESKQE